MPRRTPTAPAASKDAIDAAVEAFVTDTDNLDEFGGEQLTGPLVVKATAFLGGSSWSSAYKLTASDPGDATLDLFVKTARGRDSDSMFKGEALGLTAMREAAPSLAVPKVCTYGDAGGGSFIIMEYMKFTSGSDMRALGTAVGEMHLHGTADRYGFQVDNTIGGTPQPNPWMDDWPEFFKLHRLQHQVNLANDSRLTRMCDELISSGKYDALFQGAVLRPALVHGDLWSGNIGWANGKPALFDPATYYGHSECEL
ncbi:MAG: fructosamine kinase family protein, partial [bacterium]